MIITKVLVSLKYKLTILPLYFRLASRICRHISRVLGLHWEVTGKEYLEKDEACVIVANHQSSLDVLGKFYSSDTNNL